MSFTEQIEQLKQDFVDVRKAGYDEGYEKGKAEGGSSEDSPLYYINTLALSNMFQSSVFPENYELVFKIKLDTEISMSTFGYMAKNLKSIKLINIGDRENKVDLNSAFRDITTLETVDLTEFNRKIKKISYCFLYPSTSKLKSVYGALDFSECTEAIAWLNGAKLLEDMEFVPNTINIAIDFFWCPKLSSETIDSIINGLVNLKGQEPKKVTFHSTVMDNMTEEQWSKLIDKNWNWE